MLESIEAVTREEVQVMAEEFFQTDNIALAMLGRLGGTKIVRDDLVC
jgi:predicted Zn-dependent peptidase